MLAVAILVASLVQVVSNIVLLSTIIALRNDLPVFSHLKSFMGTAILALLFVHDRGELWLIYVVAGLYGATGSALYSARSAFLTIMLPRELLGEANAIFATIREGLRLVSPLFGAGLYAAFGGGVVAIADAASFALVVVALTFVRTPESQPVREEHHFVTELVAGVRHIFATLPLKQIVLTTGVCLLVVGFAETLIFAVVDSGLHRQPSFLGVLESMQGVGAILGGVTAAAALRRVGDVRLVGIGMALFALGDGTFATHSLLVISLGFAILRVGVASRCLSYALGASGKIPLGDIQTKSYRSRIAVGFDPTIAC